jgi:hypothetical protein
MEEVKKVAFLAKSNEFDKDGKKGIVEFKLKNDQVVELDMTKVSPENMYRLAVHGAGQKIGDAAANYSKTMDYAGAYAEMSEIRDMMYTADWSRKKDGAGRQAMEDLIAALTKLKGLDEEVVRATVLNSKPETIKKWVGNSAVNAEIADIRKKRAVANKKASNDSIDDIVFE